MDVDISKEGLSAAFMNNSDTDVDNDGEIDLYTVSPVKEILIATFVSVFIVSLAGNVLVVFVIVRNRSMHTVTNFFLLNLAVSDLLVTLCCVIPTLLWFTQDTWRLGVFICKAHKAAITMTTTASVFMLTVISMERFIAILYPFQTKRILTVQRLIGVVIVIWLLSITLSVPLFVFYELVPYRDNETFCAPSRHFLDNGAQTQGIVMVIVCYVLPLMIMLVLYTKIGQGLWARSRSGSNPLTASMPVESHKGAEKSKSHFKVTYKRNKAVSSLAETKKTPVLSVDGLREGLRIHIGPQLSPPPPETPCLYSDNEDTPHEALLRPSSCETTPRKSRHAPEMIGPFFVFEPDENENENFVEFDDRESTTTTVLWKPCNDVILSSNVDKSIPEESSKIEIKITENGSNGVGSHHEEKRSDNLNNVIITDNTDESTPCIDKTSTEPEIPSPQHLTPGRTQGGVKSRLGSKTEGGDKRQIHRKYEPAPNSGQTSLAYGRGNSHSLSQKCFKKTPSKRKRNAEAVMAARRKVIRLLVVMVVCFAVCLFPLQFVFVLSLFGGFDDRTVPGALLTAFTYLAYFMNSALNPFLYAFLSDNFRTRMRETLHCGSSRARRQASLRQTRLKSMTSDAYTESELMPS
ncbi:uncharacterized protein [Asterias amurensis]|uniref:uncharacterized protein n=1 Tax=Asterias amurensis TaxID=7602 RepID=UPI003AB1FA25